jgi:aryl-alcohol dehydrogenase-like predicted oxidoreductase
MISRRQWLRTAAGAGAALGLGYRDGLVEALAAQVAQQPVMLKRIPSSGEQVPVIGLGGRWISANASAEELAGHRAVLRALAEGAEGAGRVFDTAAGYGGGGSEEYAGRWAAQDGLDDRIFWATKVNVAEGGNASADPAAVRAQIERSFTRLRVPVIDLNQVHNMGDPPTQLGVLREYKEAGRIRHIGITTTSQNEYAALAQVMRTHPIDFIGIDYAIDNRTAEETIFPLAQDRGIAVMVYLPFGRTRMWNRIGDRPLPEWASEFDAATWAQFMLKYVVAQPAVTLAVPGTSDAEHMVDNLGGGRGRLPTPEHLRRIPLQRRDDLGAVRPGVSRLASTHDSV